MDASTNDIEMADVSTKSRLQTPIEVEESDPLNPDAIVVDIQPETLDDPDGPNNIEEEVKVIIEEAKIRQKKWFR